MNVLRYCQFWVFYPLAANPCSILSFSQVASIGNKNAWALTCLPRGALRVIFLGQRRQMITSHHNVTSKLLAEKSEEWKIPKSWIIVTENWDQKYLLELPSNDTTLFYEMIWINSTDLHIILELVIEIGLLNLLWDKLYTCIANCANISIDLRSLIRISLVFFSLWYLWYCFDMRTVCHFPYLWGHHWKYFSDSSVLWWNIPQYLVAFHTSRTFNNPSSIWLCNGQLL